MADQLQHKHSTGCGETSPPVEFIAVCVVAFIASVAATVYFCRSMCCEMEMPGGWTMSMMWMRMPGHTWLASVTTFLLMWLAMMIAMMLPSALPTFLKTRRAAAALSLMAIGYFAVWLISGVGIYALGVAFAAAAMRWENFSRVVPLLSGAALVAELHKMLAVAQNHPPGVESRGFKITHPEKLKGLANRLRSGADFGHVKHSQDGLGQRNTGTQKQRLVEAAHRPGAPDRPADGAKIPSRRLKFTPIIDPRHRAG